MEKGDLIQCLLNRGDTNFCTSNEGQFMSKVQLLCPALMIASTAFQSAASILKLEFVFIDGARHLKVSTSCSRNDLDMYLHFNSQLDIRRSRKEENICNLLL